MSARARLIDGGVELRAACERDLVLSEPAGFQALPGRGLHAMAWILHSKPSRIFVLTT
jgi:hypothetical protein